MGGGAKTPRQSNSARNAAKLAEAKGGADAASLRDSAVRQRNARKRNPLLGGPEGFISTLGGGSTTLGVNG